VRGAPADVLGALQEGDLEVLGLLPRSSNYTFLARVDGSGGQPLLAVYKPRSGETPLWDFPRGTLCDREVAAWVLSEALGWPWIPPTVIRDGPHGEGSVQLFVEFDPAEHYLTMREDRPDDFRRIALFDVVANNADRKSGHCLLSDDGRVFAIDHGVCFHDEPKLRTVIWDFVGETLTGPMADDLRRVSSDLEHGELRARLETLLAPNEVRATRDRLDGLLAEARFPGPGPGRPYPWPIV
jgi:uncharacterized repeat protein (TIGR03843 family)